MKTRKIVAGVVPLLLSACGPELAEQQSTPRQSAEETRAGEQFRAAAGSIVRTQVQNYEDRSEVGTYFCDPYYYDPYCGCPSYDPYCEGLPPPPPPPPDAPKRMTYTPFSESSSITVSWSGSPTNDETYYELERLSDGYYWENIYSGSQRSAGGGIYAEGEYSFRVRACNDNGCSPYLTDPRMRFSNGPSRSAPGFMKAEVENFLRALGYETPPTLGLGYDNLRQELTKNNCMDMSGGSSFTQDARTKDFKLNMAYSRDELSTLLSLTQNLGISAKYGKISATYSGKKELLSTSTRIEETTMVVASLRDQFRVESIYNPGMMSLSGTSVNMLMGGDRARFRNVCGDGFVYSIAHGRQFYITFQLNSFNHSREEIRTQTQNLKIDIGDYVGATYDQTKKSQITQKYSGYNVKAHVISYGSSTGVTGVVSLDAALQFMKDFEAEPVSNGSYPIDFKTDDYDVPAGVTSFPHYAPYKTILQRWYSFDHQLARRCEMFDDNLYPDPAIFMTDEAKSLGVAGGMDLRNACFMIKRAVQENIQNCEDTNKWSQCIQPDSRSCFVPDTGVNCLDFANRLPYWTGTSATLSLDADLGGGMSSDSKTTYGTACMTGSQTIRDQRIKSVDCTGQGGCPSPKEGVTVKTTQLHRASNGWNSYNLSNKCLSAQVTISRPGWWTSGAHVHQTQTVNGLVPQSVSFQF